MFLQDPRYPFQTLREPGQIKIYNVDAYKTELTAHTEYVYGFVRKLLERATERNAVDYDKRFKVKPAEIMKGARVFIKQLLPRKHKLESKYVGPFRVIEAGPDSVTVRNLSNDKKRVVHKAHVKLCKEEDIERESEGRVVPPVYPCPGFEIDEDLICSN